jgi:ABC-type uncharacterized transport system auxiliary subunit
MRRFAPPITILVGRVATPQLYRDSRIVYGSGPVQLGTYEYNRWAQMPSDMIQEALISALRSTGQYRSVTAVGSTARGDFVVRSQLYSLYEVDQPQIAGRFSMQTTSSVLRVETVPLRRTKSAPDASF